MANKGVTFGHGGEPRAMWFSNENTVEERRSSGKVALMARALVGHLNEVGEIDLDIAKKHIDADYIEGILVRTRRP